MVLVEANNRSGNHYINERALSFSENDLGDPQRIAVSLVSGTVIMVNKKDDGDGVAIPRAANGDYEKWTLRGYSTKIPDGRNAAHYIFARLSRTDRTALIIFSLNNYNIDGSISTFTENEDGTKTESRTEASTEHYYIRIGYLTETDGTSDRVLTYDSGQLSVGYEIDEIRGSWNELFIPHYDDPADPKKLTWIEAKSHMGIQGGVTMFIEGEDMNLPNIYDGLPIDGDSLYWEEDEEGNKVLKAKGEDFEGTLGALKNVGAWADAAPEADRIMMQKKGSEAWETLPIEELGTASFENVKEDGEGNAYTAIELSEDKKTLTLNKGESFAKQTDYEALNTKVTDFLEGSDTDNIINKWKELEKFLGDMTESDELATILSGKADKATTLSGYGITNAYTKTEVTNLLKDYLPLAGGTVTGNLRLRTGAEYTSPYLYFGDGSEVYLREATDQYLTVHADRGIVLDAPLTTIDGIDIKKSADGVLFIDANLVVSGGITMYGTDSVTASTIMDAISVDGTTIMNDGTKLYLNPNLDLGGGVSSWEELEGKPSWIGSSKPTYTFNEITSKPTTIAGYGITDVKIADGVITLGSSTITPLTQEKGDARYITSIGTSGNYLTYTKNGATQNVTVPYAVNTDKLDGTDSTGFYKSNAGSLESDELETFVNRVSGGYSVTYRSASTGAVSYSGMFSVLKSGAGSVQAIELIANNYTLKQGALQVRLNVDGTRYSATKTIAFSDGNVATADTASKLSTSNKTAWGQTYWTSGGVPTDISGNMTGVGNITMSGNINSAITINSGDDSAWIKGTGHKMYFGGTGYANQSYYFRPLYSASGATTSNLYIQNASAAANPTFTTTHSFLSNGNASHAGSLTINGIELSKSKDDILFIDANLVVRGAITMYGTNSATAPTIMDAIAVDGTTIMNDGKKLYLNPNLELGGLDEDELNSYLTSNKYLTQTTGDARYITAIGTSGNYLTYTKNGVTQNVTVPYALNADKLDGMDSTKFPLLNAVYGSSSDLNDADRAGYYKVSLSANLPSGFYEYGMLETIEVHTGVSDTESRTLQVYYPHLVSSSYSYYGMAQRTRNGGSWSTWKYFVTKDGNVASATKLQTSRTIWGQSFDGTASISGNMTGVGSISMSGALGGATTGTFSSTLSGNEVVITNSGGTTSGHLRFSRASANYIAIPTGGSLAVNLDGSINAAGSDLIVRDGAVHPGTSGATSLGRDGNLWNGLYLYGGSASPAFNKFGINFGADVARISANSSGGLGVYAIGTSSRIFLRAGCTASNASSTGLVVDADGNVEITGNLLVKGGVTMYADTDSSASSIWDNAPLATTGSTKGIASFDPDFFSVANGVVTFIGETGGSGGSTSMATLSWSGYSSGSYNGTAAKTITIPSNTNQLTNGAGFITTITKSMVTTALGFTPYNATNPNGYVTSSGSVASATKATQDGSGNVITSTYLKLSGGTMTGTLTSMAIAPSASGSYDLGTSANRWLNVWTGNVKFSDSKYLGFTSSYVSICAKSGGSQLIVAEDAVRTNSSTSHRASLGTSSIPWSGLYSTTGNFSDKITLTGTTAATSTIAFSRENANYITFPSSGFLNIGTASSSASTVVSISATGNLSIDGTLTQGSDIRYKTIHSNIQLPLALMSAAPSFEFHFNSDTEMQAHIGTSAQYWQKVNGVVRADEGGRLHMDYSSLGVVMGISLAKELSRFESDTDRRIRLLEEENKKLKEEIEQLKTA